MSSDIVTRKRIELNQAVVSKRLRLRLSRTGGISGAWHPLRGITFNTQHGFRLSKTRRGLTLGWQSGRFVFRGRWNLGKHFRLNLSKTKGLSLSWKNSLGAFNLTRPQYSSAKIFGIQFRGHKAHELQVFFAMFKLLIFSIQLFFLSLAWVLSACYRVLRSLFFVSFFTGQLYQLSFNWIFHLGKLAGIVISALVEVVWLETRILTSIAYSRIFADALPGEAKQSLFTQQLESSGPPVETLSEDDAEINAEPYKRRKPSVHVSPSTSVSDVTRRFRESFKIATRIYAGSVPADPNQSLSEIASFDFREGDFWFSGRSKVATVERNFKRDFGVTLRVRGEHDVPVSGSRTIASVRLKD